MVEGKMNAVANVAERDPSRVRSSKLTCPSLERSYTRDTRASDLY